MIESALGKAGLLRGDGGGETNLLPSPSGCGCQFRTLQTGRPAMNAPEYPAANPRGHIVKWGEKECRTFGTWSGEKERNPKEQTTPQTTVTPCQAWQGPRFQNPITPFRNQDLSTPFPDNFPKPPKTRWRTGGTPSLFFPRLTETSDPTWFVRNSTIRRKGPTRSAC